MSGSTTPRADLAAFGMRAEVLRALGDAADRSMDIWMPQLDRAIDFVQGELLPHLDAADGQILDLLSGLDPRKALAQCADCDRSAMSDLGMQLAFFRAAAKSEMPSHLRDLRRVAYGLYALVQTQLDREERLLRLLEAGSAGCP